MAEQVLNIIEQLCEVTLILLYLVIDYKVKNKKLSCKIDEISEIIKKDEKK